jgi:hypothetical protein
LVCLQYLAAPWLFPLSRLLFEVHERHPIIFAISPFASFLTYSNQEKGYNLEFGNKGLNPHKNFLEWSPFFCITQQSSRHCAHDGRTSFTWKSP